MKTLALLALLLNADAIAVKKVTIAQVLKTKGVKTVDVNTPAFRELKGTIPGSVLLSSATQFMPGDELPAAKETPLVFFCVGRRCTASEAAARRASEAGYVDVAVLPAGLEGWRDAGLRTVPVKARSP